MPAKIARPCRNLRCAELTIARNGFCEKHKHSNWERHQDGKSAAARGYGSAWKRLRAKVIERAMGVCEECMAWSRVTPGTEVDHIKPKAQGGSDSLDNLQLLCESCHRIKTAREH